MTETQLRRKYINGLLAIEGKCAEGGANHSALLAVYNTLDPLPRGVKMLPLPRLSFPRLSAALI